MFLIATASEETLARWKQGLEGFAPLWVVTDLDSLAEGMRRRKPQVLLLDLDLPGLDDMTIIAGLRKLNCATNIVALSGAIPDETELALFKAGVRGCCRSDIDPQLLKRIVIAVQQGEVWIRRTLTPRLLDELGALSPDETQPARAIVGRLADLTERQLEIAALVGTGDSNKQIARQLVITERTVKAHLTEIFRKLGVADRLKLALIVTGISDV